MPPVVLRRPCACSSACSGAPRAVKEEEEVEEDDEALKKAIKDFEMDECWIERSVWRGE